jgi:hypothetical protein
VPAKWHSNNKSFPGKRDVGIPPSARFWNTQNVGISTPCETVLGRHLARRARSTAAQLARRLGA